MAVTQVGHIITIAMRRLRILPGGGGQDSFPSAAEYADYVDVFNVMRREWSAKRYLNPQLVDDALTFPAGFSNRSIGTAGQLLSERPIKIISAVLRDSANSDFRFPIIRNRLEYDSLPNKSMTGKPCEIFYEPAYPTGIIYFDKITDAAYTLLLQSQKQVGDYLDQNAVLVDPLEYHEPFINNLCIRIADENSAALLTPAIVANAREGLRDIRRLRAADQIEALVMPGGLDADVPYGIDYL